MKKETKQSPLKAEPLRNPGQSLDEEINELWEEKASTYFYYLACFLAFTAADWYRWLTKEPINPFTTSIITAIVTIFCVYKIIGIIRKTKQLKLARDGEKLVGQYLDELKETGARVLHDIIGENFNVDHVVFSEHGIFVIDTKTYSKPIKGDAKIHVKNDEVYVDNYPMERNPLKQSRALSKWIQDLLQETTGKKYPVKGVVVFPGWYVEKMTGKEDIWVLNPKALPAFIGNEPQRLQPEQVRLAHYHLSRYVRSKY